MKKFKHIFLTALIALALSACSRQRPDTLPTTQNTGRFDLSENHVALLDTKISELSLWDFFPLKRIQRLRVAGIQTELAEIIRVDYDNLFYHINLTNSMGNTLSLGGTAKLMYQFDNDESPFYFQGITRGNITVENGRIIHTTLNDIAVYDEVSFEKENIDFDFSFIPEGENFILLDTITTRNGYVTAYYSKYEQGFAFFSPVGKLIEKRAFTYNTQGYNSSYFGWSVDEAQADAYMLNHSDIVTKIDTMAFTDKSETRIAVMVEENIRFGHQNILYDIENNIAYELYEDNAMMFDYNGWLSVYWARPSNAYKENAMVDLCVAQCHTINHSRGTDREIMVFEEKNIRGLTAFDRQIAYDEASDTYIVTVPRVGLNLKLNFNTDTGISEYQLTDSHLKNLIATSSDGKYSIYTVTNLGISYNTVAVKNNATGYIKFIGNREYLYRNSFGQPGFLANNDVYMLKDENYEIYSADSNSHIPQFSLNDYMAFGEAVSPLVRYRYLCGVLRDEENSRYIVAYYDIPQIAYTYEKYIDEKNFILKYPYKIAVLDYSGNIIAQYETATNVYEVKHSVNLWLSGETLYITVRNLNTSVVVQSGRLDLETGIYTPEINVFEK